MLCELSSGVSPIFFSPPSLLFEAPPPSFVHIHRRERRKKKKAPAINAGRSLLELTELRQCQVTVLHASRVTYFSRYLLLALLARSVLHTSRSRAGRKEGNRSKGSNDHGRTRRATEVVASALAILECGRWCVAVRLCARSGDRRRDEDNRAVSLLSLLSLRGYIVADELLPAAWCSRTRSRIVVDKGRGGTSRKGEEEDDER